MEQKLSFIMASDVVGYSRLMGIDERGTLSALKRHRQELLDVKIAPGVFPLVLPSNGGVRPKCSIARSFFRRVLVRQTMAGFPRARGRYQGLAGMRAMTLISKSKPASQFTPSAVQFG